METEASPSPIKQKRYDLSMSKRTRRTNSSKVATQVNTRVESVPMPVTPEEKREAEQVLKFTLDNKAILQETVFAPITSEEKKQAEQVLNCTADNKLVVKETVFAPATPRPSLIELIRVTNKEERNATEVAEQSLVRKKVSQEEKEKLSSAVVQQHQIVKVAKSPGVVRRCAKALNQMIKVRHAPKQKSVVPLIAI